MNNEQNTNVGTQGGQENAPSRRSILPWITGALAVGLAVALWVGAQQHTDLVNLRLESATLSKEMASIRQSLAAADENVDQKLGSIRQELESTRKEAVEKTQYATQTARKQAKLVVSELTQRQEEQGRQLAQQLNEIRTSGEQTAERITQVSNQVGSVKTDVASTRTDLDKVASDLHRTTGDMGVMSGLIATNSKELAVLRELGERDYFEFSLVKTKTPQRVGDILLLVKKTDPKRNRFTVEIVADDKKVEKKDKTINEPVQFYVASQARQPYEIVVNSVNKNQLAGYLAVPKVKGTIARRQS
jgi:hypothetical protein